MTGPKSPQRKKQGAAKGLEKREALQPQQPTVGTSATFAPAYLNSRLDNQLDSKLDAKLDGKLDAKLDGKLDAKLDGKLDGKLDAGFERLQPMIAVPRNSAPGGRAPIPPALMQLYASQLSNPMPGSSGDAISLDSSPVQPLQPATHALPAESVSLATPTTAHVPVATQTFGAPVNLAPTVETTLETTDNPDPIPPTEPVQLVSPAVKTTDIPESTSLNEPVSVSLDEQPPITVPSLPATTVPSAPVSLDEAPSTPAETVGGESESAPEGDVPLADLLEQPEPEVPVAPSPPTTSGVRGSMAAIRSEVHGRTAAIPEPNITAGTEASRRAAALGTEARAGEAKRVEAVASSAAGAIPPVPAELPTSILSHDNPVPGIQAVLQVVSNLTLPNQTPPKLERTPGNNLPVLGRQPLSPDMLRRLQSLETETPPVGPAEERQRAGLVQMREQLMTIPEMRDGEGAVSALVDLPPPAHPEIPPGNRTQISQALARLLANPTAEAQGMVDRGRRAAFVANVLANNETTSALGNDTLLSEFADILGVQFDAIREEAGITATEMDTEVQRYREQLETQRQQQEQEAQMSIDDGSANVMAANQHVSDAIAGSRTAMDEHREEVQASYGGENQRAAIEGRRDRIIRDINRHIGQQDANYRRAGETRARELDAGEAAQIAAYRYAVQQDEFQLNRNRATLQLTPAQDQAIPRDVTDRVSYHIQVQVAVSQKWLEIRLRTVRATFTGLKTAARTTTESHRSAAAAAADTARQQVRDWAQTALGEEMSWLDRILALISDWFGAAEANAQAWETVQNQETAVAASNYVDMIAQVQAAANSGITEQKMLEASNLTAEERAIIQAFFNPPDGGTPGDPIAAVAFGIRERVYQQRAGELKSRFESMVLDGNCGVTGTAYVDLLNAIGRAYTPGFDAWNRAAQLNAAFHPGLTGLGTEEEEVFTALANLNPVQAKAVRAAYQSTYGESLDTALAGEMDTDGERNRARGLLEGNRAISDAAALHMAMNETYLGTGFGTERDLIMTTLRNKSPEEITAIVSAYQSTYGGNLREQLRGELNDWATLSTHDADMANAYMNSNTELADAIGMDQAMHGFSWGYAFNLAYGTNFEVGGRDEFTAVTDRIRQEVSQDATRNNWTEAQFQAEVRRRLARVESTYDNRYGDGQAGALRAAVGDRFDSGPNRDLINATLNNDEIRADAARIAAERYDSVVYASDDVITQAIERRYNRALEAARRDSGPALRQEMNTELQRLDNEFFATHGHYMTGRERYAEQQRLELRMERSLESLARTAAQRDTRRMDTVFAEEYGNAHGETLNQAVVAATSGVSEEQATTALSQGGYLTRYQRFDFAVRGPGTEEEAAQTAINGATQEELAEMDARWRRTHNGESLRDRALSELSGTNSMDMTIALEGRPMTVEDALRVERLRVQLEQPTSWAGGFIAEEERGIVRHHLRELEANAERMDRPVRSDADREARDRIMGEFSTAQEVLQGAVQIHRARVASITDAVANTASMIAAVAVGALVSFVSAGAATPLAIALIASVASTLTSIGTRWLLMGNQYGHEELLNDVIIGVVDAIVAAATAGLGNRLLGINQITRSVAGGVTRKGFMGVLQQIERRMVALAQTFGGIGPLTRRVPASRMLSGMYRSGGLQKIAAVVISESVENAVGALPTAVVGAVIDDNNWKGGFQFGNALQGVTTQVGMGVGMGLAMSGGMSMGGRVFSGIRNAISGPRLGADIHVTTREHLPTTDAQVNAARDAYMSQPHPDGTPRTEADFDTALQRERQRHLDDYLARNPGKTEADFDADLRADAAVQRSEFDEMHRGALDFDADVGKEAGIGLHSADTEYRQRQAYYQELNDAAPAGRQGDFGDVPISILSAAEFFRLTGRTSGDAAVIMRDGQAHLLVREGASPASVRAEAARLADMTAAGTGGRAHNPADALPSDLRGRVHMEVDENLPARTVEVHYETHNGVITGVWVQVGPGARAVDIHMHANVVRSMRRLQGLSGQAHLLLNRMRLWVGMNIPPAPGTRAFEARLEMEKLPSIISERAAALRRATTPEEQMRLSLEVENLRNQMEGHARFVDAIETEPGVGYVAARDLSPKEITNALNTVAEVDVRNTLAGLSPAEQAQLLHHVALINRVAGIHADPSARAYAVGEMVQMWRKLNEDFHAADSSFVNRLLTRVANSGDPIAVLSHLESIMTLPHLDPAHYQTVVRDLGYNQSAASLLDQTTAIRNLIDSRLPDAVTGHILVSALNAPDRIAYLNAITRLVGEPGIRATLAGMSPAAQTQLLAHADLINRVAAGHADPAARAAAVAQVINVWNRLNTDLATAEPALLNRLMTRITASSDPGAVASHLETLMTLPHVDPAHYQAIVRDLGNNQSTASLVDQTRAISGLIQRGLPGDITGHLLVSAIGTPDRVAYLHAVTQLTGLVSDPAILRAIADRMNGTPTRGAMGAGARTDFVNGIAEVTRQAETLGKAFPEYAHLTGHFIQGAVDAHFPFTFLGDPPAFTGEVHGFIKELDSYARGPEATAARALNAEVDAVLLDPTLAPLLAGFTMPGATPHTAFGSALSGADILQSIRKSLAHNELGRVHALVQHLATLGMNNRATVGVQLKPFMARISTLLDGMDTTRLARIAELEDFHGLLQDYARHFDRVVNNVIHPGARRVDYPTYKLLRAGTPTQDIRDAVNLGFTPPFPDPALPGLKVTKNMHADHIVSMDTITRMKNFELLTFAEQQAVLNFEGPGSTIPGVHGNFVGLSETANTSKGAKSYSAWTVYQKGNIPVNPAFRAIMIAEETRLMGVLQAEINRVLVARGVTLPP